MKFVDRLRSSGLEIRLFEGRVQCREMRPGAKDAMRDLLNLEIDAIRKELEIELTPYVDENENLVFPLCCNAKYRWWQGGQSIDATLEELKVPERIRRRYSNP